MLIFGPIMFNSVTNAVVEIQKKVLKPAPNQGLFGFVKFILKTIAITFIAGLVLTMIPGLPPHDMQFTAYDLPTTKQFKGALSLNRKLDNAEKLFENELHGPESLVSHNGVLYVGLHGGNVVKIDRNKILPFVKFGKPCSGFYEEHICGRPLGMALDKSGNLYVADAYYGLFKVNTSTKETVKLVDPDTVIEGRKPKLFNAVTVASDGTVYWTDSDSNVYLHDGIYSMLADGTGRLIKYDPITKKNTVLVDRLTFANGVALSRDESFVIVAESFKYRLLRYHLKGPKKGRQEVFVDALPGAPDNIKPDGKGNFFVSLVAPRDEENTPSLILNIGRYPLLRKCFARTLALLELALEKLKPISPELFCEKATHAIGHFETLFSFLPEIPRVTLLLVNQDGVIINSFHALDNRIRSISEVEPIGEHLYLGSPFNKYLARVRLPSELK